jgi:hypothetical protein
MSWTTCRIYALTLALILVSLTGGGCATLTKLPGLGKAETKPPAPQIKPGQATVKMKIESGSDEPRRIRLPLGEGMLIEDALKGVGLTREFSDMSLLVFRTLPDGKKMKLEVHYDKSKNRVVPAYNYALLPGDLILVKRKTTSPLDGLLDAINGPLVQRYSKI